MYMRQSVKKQHLRHFEVNFLSIFVIFVSKWKLFQKYEFSNLDRVKRYSFRREMKMFVFYGLSRRKVWQHVIFSGILKTAVNSTPKGSCLVLSVKERDRVRLDPKKVRRTIIVSMFSSFPSFPGRMPLCQYSLASLRLDTLVFRMERPCRIKATRAKQKSQSKPIFAF